MSNMISSIQFPDWSPQEGLPMLRITMAKTRAFFEIKAFMGYMFESFPSLGKSLGRGETKETCTQAECRESFSRFQNCTCMSYAEFYSDDELFAKLDMFYLPKNLEIQFKDDVESIEDLPTQVMSGYTVLAMLQPLMDAFKDEVRDRLPKIMAEFTSNEISADTFMLLYENYIG